MPTYRDEGVVLRTHKLGEADRIITLLTRQRGKVRAVARAVRRTSSKFGARLEPCGQVDLQFAEGRSLDVVTQVVSMNPWGDRLARDYGTWTTAQVMLETADRLVTEENEPALQHYLLLCGALRAMVDGTTDGPRPASLLLDSYLLRALSIAGYAPVLDACARCGLPGPHSSFAPALGGLVCSRCRPPGSAAVGGTGIELMTALLTGDWVATREVTDATRREVSGLVSAFAAWHLERGLRSLPHVERS